MRGSSLSTHRRTRAGGCPGAQMEVRGDVRPCALAESALGGETWVTSPAHRGVECHVQLQDVDACSSKESERRPLGVRLDRARAPVSVETPRAAATRAACIPPQRAEYAGSSPAPLAVTISDGTWTPQRCLRRRSRRAVHAPRSDDRDSTVRNFCRRWMRRCSPPPTAVDGSTRAAKTSGAINREPTTCRRRGGSGCLQPVPETRRARSPTARPDTRLPAAPS